MASRQLSIFTHELQSLYNESKRKHPDIRDASDKSLQQLKNAPDQCVNDLRYGGPLCASLLQPLFLGLQCKNPKVITVAINAAQKLLSSVLLSGGGEGWPKELLPTLLEGITNVVNQGVEIQLKILQTLVLLVGGGGSTADGRRRGRVGGEMLAESLLLCFKLQDSRIGAVSSTAAATLRQLTMFVFDAVVEEDQALEFGGVDSTTLPTDFIVTIPSESPSQDPKPLTLYPAARDAYFVFSDLCSLVNGDGEEAQFIKLSSLTKTFGLELLESVLTNHGILFKKHLELLFLLRSHLCPLLIRLLSLPSSSTDKSYNFALTLRLMRVIFILLKQFSTQLHVEAEMFLRMFIKIIQPGEHNAVDGSGGHPIGGSEGGAGSSPSWLRVLTLEIFRGLCIDFDLMKSIYERYDYDPTISINHEENAPSRPSSIFQSLLTSFHRLASERPVLLGTGTQILYGTSNGPIPAHTVSSTTSLGGVTGAAVEVLGGVMEIATQAATAAATTVTTGGATVEKPGLSLANSQVKVQCIDQLDKADAPILPDTYIFYLAIQCMTSISEGFANFVLPIYSSIMTCRTRPAGEAGEVSASVSLTCPPALEIDKLSQDVSSTQDLKLVMNMTNAGWPAILASLSFFMTTNLDDQLFLEVLQALQSFCKVCGVLNLTTPRDAFLTSICRFAVPHAIVSYVASLDSAPTAKAASVLSADALGLGSTTTTPIGLSQRNFASLKSLLTVAQYLAGSLDKTWFAVFEVLQNADQVIRTNNARAKALKRPAASSSVPNRQTAPATAASTTTAAKAAVPSEAEEQAMQASISRLFETSRNLDDSAFRSFLGALCRLSGEMVGFQMNDDGTLYFDTVSPGLRSPDASTDNGEAFSLPPPSTPSSARRRISGMNTIKTMKAGEKSFAIFKIGSVCMLNGHRMVYREASVGWDIATNHLLAVQNHTHCSADVRLQAGEVLDQILVAASRNIGNAPIELQRRIQTQIFQAIHEQAEAQLRPQTSTDLEIRRMALDTMFKILETNGDSFVAGWDKVFNILSMSCPSPHTPVFGHEKPRETDIPEEEESSSARKRALSIVSLSSVTSSAPQSSKSSVLVRTSFPSLQLICTEFLGVLTVPELKLCISTLSEFGRQGDDINVALTAGGLLWQVADHVQVEKDKTSENKADYERLWMFLLLQLGQMCQDPRQEVRDGAMQTLFRTVSMYGGSLTEMGWEECLFEIIFPLLDGITEAVSTVTQEISEFTNQPVPPTLQMVAQGGARPIPLVAKQWDDSKTLALTSTAQLFDTFLVSKLINSEKFSAIWQSFVQHTNTSFLHDRSAVATASIKGLGKIFTLGLSENSIANQEKLSAAWAVAWDSLSSIGDLVVPSRKQDEVRFSQLQLEAFVRTLQSLQSSHLFSFDLQRIKRLLVILKVVLTHPKSFDYRPDVDTLSPVQAAVVEVACGIDLSVPEAASAVLTDLAEYLSLAFIAPFDAALVDAKRPSMHVSYIALSKKVMPQVVDLFGKFRNDVHVYEDGAVERIFSAFSIPLRLKYECPAASKFGNDPPLWKTATICFLQVVKLSLPALANLDISKEIFQSVWRQLVESFRGGILADCHPASAMPLAQQQEEESFDLALIVSLEKDVYPFIHNPLVPASVIQRLGDCLQESSRLYLLDVSGISYDSGSSDEEIEPKKESRFDTNMYHQAQGDMFGTTRGVLPRPRERFEYWCFDLLFFMCATKRKDGEALDVNHRRTATLILPSLLSRCSVTIRTYIADVALQGRMPMNRQREEELLYVLRCLLSLKLEEETYAIAFASTDNASDEKGKAKETFSQRLKSNVAASLSTSTCAHLYYFYSHLCEILESHEGDINLSPPPSLVVPYRLAKPLVVSEGYVPKGFPKNATEPGFIGRPWPLELERKRGAAGLDNLGVKALIIECLRLIGREIGLGF